MKINLEDLRSIVEDVMPGHKLSATQSPAIQRLVASASPDAHAPASMSIAELRRKFLGEDGSAAASTTVEGGGSTVPAPRTFVVNVEPTGRADAAASRAPQMKLALRVDEHGKLRPEAMKG